MGYRGYNEVTARQASVRYQTMNAEEIFASELHHVMDGRHITLRECRDSEINPVTIPVILGLDVTGSMGTIPERLIKGDLAHAMGIIKEISPNESHSMLFMGIGDHRSDQAPLQLGQFENSDEDMNQWFEKIWLEGHGGGNGGESYALAWIFAGNNVITDHWEKRKAKGVLITIGDEDIHMHGPSYTVGGKLHDYDAPNDLKKAQQYFNVYHLHCNFSRHLSRAEKENWKSLLGERYLEVDRIEDIKEAIGAIIGLEATFVEPNDEVTNTSAKEEEEPGNNGMPDLNNIL